MKRCLYFTVILIVTTGSFLYADEHEDIWADHPGVPHNPEMVERVLDRIAQGNPELAEELRELHETNPEAFRERILDMMRSQRNQRQNDRENINRPGERNLRDGRPEPPRGGGGGGRGDRMDRHIDEYMQWLEENYPDEFMSLTELRQQDEKTFQRRMELSLKKYGRIMSIQKRNPELADVLKEDLVLKDRREQILKELRYASEDEKEMLKAELNEIVSTRFDLIVKQKELQYQSLLKKLEQLEEEIEKRQQEVNSLIERKHQAVESRMGELLNESEQINWD